MAENYKLIPKDFAWFCPGLTEYMARNEFEDGAPCYKLMCRSGLLAATSTILTIGAIYGAWKGLEALIK